MNPWDDFPSVTLPEDEEDRERAWYLFECECQNFARREPDGWTAVLRAVARAMKDSEAMR